MKWIEAIRLAAPAHRRETLCEALREELSRVPRVDGLVAVRLLADACVETELSVLLDWDTDGPHRSALADHLVRALEDLGLVHRATWLDLTDSPSDRRDP